MSNPQQPEVRRSGHDPVVAGSAKERASGHPRTPAGGRRKDLRPAKQRSRYEPGIDEEREAG
ncbi:hypothetical protein GCM10022251_08990 [Phytohabitans flavus]|uniref:Uncharacterized protein n=1 Tax=Phytohabitans flavus TaxID=1076124 RepID=A0A6F8Y1Q2_9ACTN|nr:hypothetical protein [Phytohabitans flavus]BCB79908.1 hypothetical protein Pflav_063180 [Phytohabitans flavus]